MNGRAAKVGDADSVPGLGGHGEEYVLGLEVPVDEPAAVDVLEPRDDLAHDPLKLLVLNLGSLLQEGEEVAA